jgi:hypothetical protein
VEASEHPEDILVMLLRYSDAIVLHGEDPLVPLKLGPYPNTGTLLVAELEGIADEVLEQAGQLKLVAADHWQLGALDIRITLANGLVQVAQNCLGQTVAVHWLEGLAAHVDP